MSESPAVEIPSEISRETDKGLALEVGQIFNLLIPEDHPLMHTELAQTRTLDLLERRHDTFWKRFTARMRNKPIVDENIDDTDRMIVELGMDLARSVQTGKEMEQLAMYDHVTGAFSRAYAERFIVQELMQATRSKNLEGNPGLALITLDLDNFKFVNDTFGHTIGDKVLRLVASSLQVRGGDVVARSGGDEFWVLMSTDDYKALKMRVVGSDEENISGSAEGTWLKQVNDSITNGLHELGEELGVDDPNEVWKAATQETEGTYFSAGMSFLGRGVIGEAITKEGLESFSNKLIKDSDDEEMRIKRLRKTERKSS